jgi:superfamily II DNA/RNA helicase
LIPIFEKLLKDADKIESDDVKALIISPTRELAYQIYKVASKFSEALGKIGVKCSFGQSGEKDGADSKKESEFAKSGQNILIITPGRLADALKENTLNLKNIEFLILDEADRLLDSNFQQELKNIILQLPKQRRTGLFSATLSSQKLDELIKVGLRNPVIVRLTVNYFDSRKKTMNGATSTKCQRLCPISTRWYLPDFTSSCCWPTTSLCTRTRRLSCL